MAGCLPSGADIEKRNELFDRYPIVMGFILGTMRHRFCRANSLSNLTFKQKLDDAFDKFKDSMSNGEPPKYSVFDLIGHRSTRFGDPEHIDYNRCVIFGNQLIDRSKRYMTPDIDGIPKVIKDDAKSSINTFEYSQWFGISNIDNTNNYTECGSEKGYVAKYDNSRLSTFLRNIELLLCTDYNKRVLIELISYVFMNNTDNPFYRWNSMEVYGDMVGGIKTVLDYIIVLYKICTEFNVNNQNIISIKKGKNDLDVNKILEGLVYEEKESKRRNRHPIEDPFFREAALDYLNSSNPIVMLTVILKNFMEDTHMAFTNIVNLRAKAAFRTNEDVNKQSILLQEDEARRKREEAEAKQKRADDEAAQRGIEAQYRLEQKQEADRQKKVEYAREIAAAEYMRRRNIEDEQEQKRAQAMEEARQRYRAQIQAANLVRERQQQEAARQAREAAALRNAQFIWKTGSFPEDWYPQRYQGGNENTNQAFLIVIIIVILLILHFTMEHPVFIGMLFILGVACLFYYHTPIN